MPNWDLYDEITTPADADTFLEHDVSETSVGHKMKKITWANIKATLKTYFDTLYLSLTGFNPPAGFMLNGQISITVASNNLIFALKGKDGNDPSATNVVRVYLGGAWRSIVAALAGTVVAGVNTFNAGGTELATKELDFFTYLKYNATDGICIGPSRMPYGAIYSDFGTAGTSEKYCAWNNIANAAAGDECAVIGRFAATLSAGTAFTWTVPTFTPANLIQHPIYETRWLDWSPQFTCSGNLTYGTITVYAAKYHLVSKKVDIEESATGTLGGTASTRVGFTLPWQAAQSGIATPILLGLGWASDTNVSCTGFLASGTPDRCDLFKYNLGNFNNSGACTLRVTGFYEAT